MALNSSLLLGCSPPSFVSSRYQFVCCHSFAMDQSSSLSEAYHQRGDGAPRVGHLYSYTPSWGPGPLSQNPNLPAAPMSRPFLWALDVVRQRQSSSSSAVAYQAPGRQEHDGLVLVEDPRGRGLSAQTQDPPSLPPRAALPLQKEPVPPATSRQLYQGRERVGGLPILGPWPPEGQLVPSVRVLAHALAAPARIDSDSSKNAGVASWTKSFTMLVTRVCTVPLSAEVAPGAACSG